MYLLMKSLQVMRNFSSEMLEEKYMTSFGLILLIGMFFLVFLVLLLGLRVSLVTHLFKEDIIQYYLNKKLCSMWSPNHLEPGTSFVED